MTIYKQPFFLDYISLQSNVSHLKMMRTEDTSNATVMWHSKSIDGILWTFPWNLCGCTTKNICATCSSQCPARPPHLGILPTDRQGACLDWGLQISRLANRGTACTLGSIHQKTRFFKFVFFLWAHVLIDTFFSLNLFGQLLFATCPLVLLF